MTRKLTMLEVFVATNVWRVFLQRHKISQSELVHLSEKMQSLTPLICEQFDSIGVYSRLRFTLGNHDKISLRIANFIHKHLERCDFVIDITHVEAYVRELATTGQISFEEIQMALAVTKLESLLRIYDCIWDGQMVDGKETLAKLCACFGALDSLKHVDHADFMRSVTPYETFLEQDPAGTYAKLSFETKTLYREAVASLAVEHRTTPSAVLNAVLNLCRRNPGKSLLSNSMQTHIGYYLIDDGRGELTSFLCQGAVSRFLPHLDACNSRFNYYIAVNILMTSIVFSFAAVLFRLGALPVALAVPVLLAVFSISSEIGNSLVDEVLPFLCKPSSLPRLDYSRGIPPSEKTVVAIPTLLVDRMQVEELTRNLEENYLSTSDKHVYFAVLSDYMDSDIQHPTDTELDILGKCAFLIQGLNEKYARDGSGPFYLLHRERTYCHVQGKWIGFERKRGKLQALNALLLNGTNGFDFVIGDVANIRGAKFVSVLDDNSALPLHGIQTLVGILAHPLNRATLGPNSSELISHGYGILQPYPCISALSASKWRFCDAVFSNISQGSDAPAIVRSLHFDLFGDCGFFGKGLYDVQAFETLTADRIPPGRVLSHDILEGGYVKTAFAGSVSFVESCPSNLDLHFERLHRWARGDFQNLALILARRLSGLSAFAQYTVVNFVRRAISPILRLCLLLAICLGDPQFTVRRLLQYFGFLLLPEAMYVSANGIRFLFKGELFHRCLPLMMSVRARANRHVFQTVTLMHHAFVMLDAGVRTLFRLARGRNLLEWKSASYLEMRPARIGKSRVWALVSCIVALVLSAARIATLPTSPAVLALFLAWAVHPFVYYKLQRPSAS